MSEVTIELDPDDLEGRIEELEDQIEWQARQIDKLFNLLTDDGK